MISVKNIIKTFEDGITVLKGVDCEIKKGEVVAIIGPSGSGKSTLLRCMNLLSVPTYGEVWLKDKLLNPVDPYLHPDVIKASNTFKKLVAEGMSENDAILKIRKEDLLKEKKPGAEGKEYTALMKKIYAESHIDINLARQKMGMVFQHFNLFNNMNVLDNLTLAPVELKLKTKEEAEANAMALLRRIGLEDKASAFPSTLSGGQKQRIAIAGVLAMEPDIIVLDEPTAMLDPIGRREIIETVKKLNREKNMTVILITHYMEEAVEADRVVVIDSGVLEFDGTPSEIFPQVERMRGLGLDIPQSTELAYELKKCGIDIGTDVLTVEECIDRIIEKSGE